MHSLPLYQCIQFNYVENDEVDRILSCKSTVLYYILECCYIVQIEKGRTNPGPVFAFNMQTPDRVEFLIVFCMLKANT